MVNNKPNLNDVRPRNVIRAAREAIERCRYAMDESHRLLTRARLALRESAKLNEGAKGKIQAAETLRNSSGTDFPPNREVSQL